MNTPTGTKRKGSILVIMAVIGILAMTGIAMADAPTVRSGPGYDVQDTTRLQNSLPGMSVRYSRTRDIVTGYSVRLLPKFRYGTGYQYRRGRGPA